MIYWNWLIQLNGISIIHLLMHPTDVISYIFFTNTNTNNLNENFRSMNIFYQSLGKTADKLKYFWEVATIFIFFKSSHLLQNKCQFVRFRNNPVPFVKLFCFAIQSQNSNSKFHTETNRCIQLLHKLVLQMKNFHFLEYFGGNFSFSFK